MTTSFAAALSAACDKASAKLKDVPGAVLMLAAQQVIQRSPVGDPDLWERNAMPVARRETYNATVDAYNAETGESVGRKSAKGLQRSFPNKAGKGYTGGRFRANWQFGVGSVNTATTTQTDPTGAATLTRLAGVALPAGHVLYLTNSLPYADRLESGWSKQAPAGMVRLTVLELPALIGQYLQGLKSHG